MREAGMILLGFASGSVMYSYCLPKLLLKKDVREGTKDENPGGYNAFMTDKKLGLLCILLDMLKGYLPVYLFVKKFGIHTMWIAPMLMAPVLGHAFTPFFKGKGGKALSTTAGTMLGLLSKSKAGLLLVFFAFLFSCVFKIDPFEMRVLTVMVLFNLIIFLTKMASPGVYIASWGITAVLWHKQMEKKLEDRPFTCVLAWKKAKENRVEL